MKNSPALLLCESHPLSSMNQRVDWAFHFSFVWRSFPLNFLLAFVGRTLFLLSLFYQLSEEMKVMGSKTVEDSVLLFLSYRGKSYLLVP